jgi:hypothetical protein
MSPGIPGHEMSLKKSQESGVIQELACPVYRRELMGITT